MAIELPPPTQANKAAASVETHGKKSGKPEAGKTDAANGFSTLMNLLSAPEEDSAPVTGGAQSVALVDNFDALAPVDAPLFLPPQSLPTVPAEGAAIATVSASMSSVAIAVNVPSEVSVGIQSAAPQSSTNNSGIGVLEQFNEGKFQGQTQTQILPDPDATAPLSFVSLMRHRNATPFASNQVQLQIQESKDLRSMALPIPLTPIAEPALALLTSAAGEVQRFQERSSSKSGFGQSGGNGVDAVFGTSSASVSRSDAVFIVPPATAAVADTAVAETISYWTSQGVQTAELTLEGWGESPVEVSISLHGDQAQIDFRTDQSGVRQVLEGAAAQLKELLSGQGLQLAGVSVGLSGQAGDTGENRRARPGSQRVSFVKNEASNQVTRLASHPSVGRTLDMFV